MQSLDVTLQYLRITGTACAKSAEYIIDIFDLQRSICKNIFNEKAVRKNRKIFTVVAILFMQVSAEHATN